ncbi:hypothetical protein [Halorubrum sp. SD626R]|uniref:hypothetical protein n=1 Tax=Halorubrum sp. SD626R TaxID=1419722 RepID=UPI000AFE51CF|nr:hypothetical protein [Halorubrum sp. SD626R]TKX82273.1 hypothetical protein EXE53_01330 [Halorubrum sp. SD626R]
MIPEKLSIKNLQKGIHDPSLLRAEFKRIINSGSPKNINKALNKRLYQKKYNNQFDVMSQDWDNLIILDGFRYDYFEKYNDINGDLKQVISQGSHSTEFQEKTFVGKKFHDTIYITSNPHSPRLIDDNIFYLMESVYGKDRGSHPREHYPERVIEMSLPIIKENPNKRHIIHLMQPNVPFFGPTAESIRERLFQEEDIVFAGMEPSDLPSSFSPNETVGELKEACEKGYISEKELKKSYVENIQIALNYAKKLLNEMEGKTAITADHGDMFGEPLPPLNFKHFSHKRDLYVDELRQVPWLVIESDNRREIHAESPQKDRTVDEGIVKDRLEQLGYLDYV